MAAEYRIVETYGGYRIERRLDGSMWHRASYTTLYLTLFMAKWKVRRLLKGAKYRDEVWSFKEKVVGGPYRN